MINIQATSINTGAQQTFSFDTVNDLKEFNKSRGQEYAEWTFDDDSISIDKNQMEAHEKLLSAYKSQRKKMLAFDCPDMNDTLKNVRKASLNLLKDGIDGLSEEKNRVLKLVG